MRFGVYVRGGDGYGVYSMYGMWSKREPLVHNKGVPSVKMSYVNCQYVPFLAICNSR